MDSRDDKPALPVCPKCKSTAFATTRLKGGTDVKDVALVHCAECGWIAGVVPTGVIASAKF